MIQVLNEIPQAGLRYGDEIVLTSACTSTDAGNYVLMTMEAPVFHVYLLTWAPAAKHFGVYGHVVRHSLTAAFADFLLGDFEETS